MYLNFRPEPIRSVTIDFKDKYSCSHGLGYFLEDMVKGNPASIHVDKVLQEIEDQELLNAIYFNRKIPSNTYDRAINEIKEALNF